MKLEEIELEPVTDTERAPASVIAAATKDPFFDEAPVAVKTAPNPDEQTRPMTPAKPRETTTASKPAVKPSPMLLKMRQKLGINEDTVTRVPVYLPGESEPAFTFGLRPVIPEDFRWAVNLVLAASPLDENNEPVQDMKLWEAMIPAMAIASIDEGARAPEERLTPVWEMLGVPIPTPAYVRNPYCPQASVRWACAEILFDEFRGELAHFTPTLQAAYGELVLKTSAYSTKPPEPTENPTTPEP